MGISTMQSSSSALQRSIMIGRACLCPIRSTEYFGTVSRPRLVKSRMRTTCNTLIQLSQIYQKIYGDCAPGFPARHKTNKRQRLQVKWIKTTIHSCNIADWNNFQKRTADSHAEIWQKPQSTNFLHKAEHGAALTPRTAPYPTWKLRCWSVPKQDVT